MHSLTSNPQGLVAAERGDANYGVPVSTRSSWGSGTLRPPEKLLEPKLLQNQLERYTEEELFKLATTDEQRRLLEIAVSAKNAADIGYLHSALCTMQLPHSRPQKEFEPLVRSDGNYHLLIQPRGIIEQGKHKPIGVPYGNLARLILLHLQSEAVRNQSPNVYVGKSLSEFMRRLGVPISGGPRGTHSLFKEQLLRVARCSWTIQFDGDKGSVIKDVFIADGLTLFTGGEGGKEVGEISLDRNFYDHLSEHAVPLNEGAIAKLRHNSLALDLYVWSAYRLPRVTRPTRVTWEQLSRHFGSDYGEARFMGRKLKQVLPMVQAAYPDARITPVRGGLLLEQSAPPVAPKTMVQAKVPYLSVTKRPG